VTATTFTDTGLAPATTYYYRVIASNSIGDSPPSAVVSARTAVSIAYTQAPQGTWVGSYGVDGYALLGWNGGDLVSIPSGTLVVDQAQRFIWANPTTDVRGLQSPDASTREATCGYDANQVRLHISFANGYSGAIHVYAVDFDGLGRRETVTINDGTGPQTATISADFSGGAWVNTTISVPAGGSVTVTATKTAGMNAVLSGVFLGGAPAPPAPPTNLSATALNATQVKLAWTASSGATGYRVERSPDGTAGWAVAGTSATQSFTDSNLSPSTTYFYRVSALNGPSSSAPSNVASATTAAGLPTSQSPQGSWLGVYGADGYALTGWNGGDLVSIGGASFAVDQGQRFIFQNPSVDLRALQSPDGSTRQAACAYDANQVRMHLAFNAAYSGTLHVYAVDFDGLGRRETITVNDGSGPQTANLNFDFSQGAWFNVPINVAAGGTVSITVNRTGGVNAVVSGVLLGGAVAPSAPAALTATGLDASSIQLGWHGSVGATSYKIQRSPDGSTSWTQIGTSATTAYTDTGLSAATIYYYRVVASNSNGDSAPSSVASARTAVSIAYAQAPQGTWLGVYGADGYALTGWNGGDLASIPNATFAVDQGQRFIWQNPSSDVRALQSPDGSLREATCAYDANQVRIHITFSAAYSGSVHVYAVDFDSLGRRETVTINDGSGPQTASITADFSQGAWVTAPVAVAAGGSVSILVTRTAGVNAVVSGVLLGGAPPPPAIPTGVTAAALNASQVKVGWNAVSGATGYRVERSPDGTSAWVTAGTVTTNTFTDSNLIPSTTYFYRVSALNGPSSSAPSGVVSAATQAGVATSQSPQGAWVGTYGSSGYGLLGWNGGDLVSIPNATLAVDQGQRFIWANPSTDVRALQSPDGSTRQAACAYDPNQVKIHIAFTSAYRGTLHVYAVDFDGLGRRETITVNDGSGPQTAYLSSDFSQGAWMNVPVNVAAGGTVTIIVTRVAGVNAVVSGVFAG
jgi:titin